MAAAVKTAVVNAFNRKGRDKAVFKKKAQEVDVAEQKAQIEKLKKHDEKAGKSWVERLYKANGKFAELKARRKAQEDN